MKQGVLVYDVSSRRMDIRFGLEEYYGGLTVAPQWRS